LSVVVMVVAGIVAAGSGDRQLWLAIMVYYVAQVLWLLADVFNGVFQGYQRMEYQFWTLNVNQVLQLSLTVLVVWLNLGLVALFGARLIANAAKLVMVWWISRERFTTAHLVRGLVPVSLAALLELPQAIRTWRQEGHDQAVAQLDARESGLGQRWQDVKLTWTMLWESLPVGISLILRNYIWRAGVVLTVLWLGQQQGDLVNGVLYGPLRAVQQLRIVPAAFAAAMLPEFSNRAAGRQRAFDSAFNRSFKFFLAIGLLIALGCTFLAEPLVRLLLGTAIDLVAAAQVLAVLGWVIVLYFPNWLYGVTLVALGRQALETAGLAVGLVVGFLVVRRSLPDLEAVGVAYGIMAAEGAFFLIGNLAMRSHFDWEWLLPSLAKIALAAGVAGLAFWAGSRLWSGAVAVETALAAAAQVVVVGGVGVAAFAGALVVLRAFDREEIDGVKAILRRRPRTQP
jgi:O-antigen/teichoic acid export membrane protein